MTTWLKTLFNRPEKAYVNPYFAGAVLGVVLFLAFLITGNGLGSSGATSRLKNPQRSPSSPPSERPVYSSSLARPWPTMRGRIAQAPMSQPASPTRLNRNATLAPAVPSRMSDAIARIAPAPAQTLSIAATTGCGGQPEAALPSVTGVASTHGAAWAIGMALAATG